MSRPLAISLTKPYEVFGLTKPLVHRLPRGLVALNSAMLVLSLVLGAAYVVRVNMAASKGYDLRAIEKRVDALKTETAILQDKISTASSLQALNARAAALGFVPAENLEFINPASKSYAMK